MRAVVRATAIAGGLRTVISKWMRITICRVGGSIAGRTRRSRSCVLTDGKERGPAQSVHRAVVPFDFRVGFVVLSFKVKFYTVKAAPRKPADCVLSTTPPS